MKRVIFFLGLMIFLTSIVSAHTIDNQTPFNIKNITYYFETNYNLTGVVSANDTSFVVEGLEFNLTSINPCNVTINSDRWISNYTSNCDDWLNETYNLPTLLTDSIISVDLNQTYNFTVNISRTVPFNFTKTYSLSDYYNSTIYSNTTNQEHSINITSSLERISVSLIGNTIAQFNSTQLTCPSGYSKSITGGKSYCKHTTSDVNNIYYRYIQWLWVKDNSSKDYIINYNLTHIAEDLDSVLSLTYDINTSTTNTTINVTTETITIGTKHLSSNSSLEEGNYLVNMTFHVRKTGSGGGSSPSGTWCGDGICNGDENLTTCPSDCIICGDGICSLGENESNCFSDCGTYSINIYPESFNGTGCIGRKVLCLGKMGCAFLLENQNNISLNLSVFFKTEAFAEHYLIGNISEDKNNYVEKLEFKLHPSEMKLLYWQIYITENYIIGKQLNSSFVVESENLRQEIPITINIIDYSIIIDVAEFLIEPALVLPKSGFLINRWMIFLIGIAFIVFIIVFTKYYQNKEIEKSISKV